MSEPHRLCLLLIRDLIFETRIRSTAESLGVTLMMARVLSEFSASLLRDPPRLVIVDLDSTGDEGVEAVRLAASSPFRPGVVAFGSHVAVQRAQAARDAGATHVLPRSRFTLELPTILQSMAP